MQENEIDICEEILKDVPNILNEFPEVSDFNFTAETSHFNFGPNLINQSIFPANKSVQRRSEEKTCKDTSQKVRKECQKICCFATV